MISVQEIEHLAKRILRTRYSSSTQINLTTIRIGLQNNGFMDIFQSVKDEKKFAFHAQFPDGRIYRLDDRPERAYKRLATFPWHFHDGSENKVVKSPFSTLKSKALAQFFRYVHNIVKS